MMMAFMSPSNKVHLLWSK